MRIDHIVQVGHVSTDDDIYTRGSDPFKRTRVARILELVEIGPDVSDQQRDTIRAFIAEHADIFAISVSEVNAVKGALYSPEIPADATFKLGMPNQRPWTLPQSLDVNKQVDVLIDAGILVPIEAKKVKCVSPIALAEKDH
ncbi:hypothetical protein C8F04DRAFT_977366, partial [Mycena alexandri]